jgi:two-component system LytT family response regulator
MKEIRAIIVDDELAARNILEKLLTAFVPNVTIVAKETNIPDAVLAIKEYNPDLIFLDIEMPKYAGYEIIKFIDNINFRIIFVSAYDQYAIKAFELNAIDYLLKPIDRNRLIKSVEKVSNDISLKSIQNNYQALLNLMETPKTLIVSELNVKHLLLISDILAIHAQGSYSDIYMQDGTKHTFCKNLGYFEQELKEEKSFYRSHKSWFINTSKIIKYSKGASTIELISGITAKLSRFKKADFETFLQR